MFVDLDSFSSTENGIAVIETQTFLECIGKLIGEKRTLIHAKSEVVSHAITSVLHMDDKDMKFINGEELKTFLSGEEESIIKSHLTGNLIRRLNKKNVASNCPLSNYPARFIEFPSVDDRRKEICRFYNYDEERGCLRSVKAQRNPNAKGCDMDHKHCHRCGWEGHRAFECTKHVPTDLGNSVVFRKTEEGEMIPLLVSRGGFMSTKPGDVPVPSLLVLGGRCRGRTLNSCEFLPLSPSTGKWKALPNLQEHRGSHAACSPKGTRLVLALGGGGIDGNLDGVEVLDLRTSQSQSSAKDIQDFRWNTMTDKLSPARHAFGAISITKAAMSNTEEVVNANLFAIGGWMFGTKSCESMEKLSFKVSPRRGELDWQDARWEKCSPLLTPRRLHSVAASIDGSSIFVFGGYIDERRITCCIEKYDIKADCWNAIDELPYPSNSCPLVQVVPDWSQETNNAFIIFPYSDNNAKNISQSNPSVLRYTPNSSCKFKPVIVPNKEDKAEAEHLQMPIKNWHSFSVTVSPSLRKAYLIGGLVDRKWTGRAFSLCFRTMKWQELPEMSGLPRRRLAALVVE
jgi:hypothetical protein